MPKVFCRERRWFGQQMTGLIGIYYLALIV
jgi:hypothetical protein